MIKSYYKELKDYPKHPKYKTSGLWEGTEEHYIYGKKIENIEDKLTQFPTNELGIGISIATDYTKEDVMELLKLWKSLTDLPVEALGYPDTFGFKGFYIGNMFVMNQAMRLSYNASKIMELTQGDVVEIGGGFGGIAYHLFRQGFKGTYYNFDIPYVNLIAKYFLTKMFPDKKFQFYGQKVKNPDIVLMPHYAIKDLKKCDLVFNSHSLSEMGKEQIEEYLKQIDRIANKFLHINHPNQAWLEGQKIDPIDLSKIEMPGWRKVYEKPDLFVAYEREQDYTDYYEYYYEKAT